jgi:hypothetical protein
VRNFLDVGGAASRAGDDFFVGLFLEFFEAGKPSLKGMVFPADEIVDHHRVLVDYSIRSSAGVVKSRVASESGRFAAPFGTQRFWCKV